MTTITSSDLVYGGW